MKIFLRSTLFNILFITGTLLISLIGIPFLLAPAPVVLAVVARPWGLGTIHLARLVCGINFEIHGREHLPEGSYMIASKHQSAWETAAFYALLEAPVFILKKELLAIPLYGNYLKAVKSIVVDRQAGAKALKKMVTDAQSRIAEDRTVIIFPEGTRIPAGQTGEYQAGVSAIYSRCDLPVVPVAVNSGVFWAKNAYMKTPGKIVMEVLPPIQPGLRRDQFMGQLEEQIETTTRKLEAESAMIR